MHDTTPTANPKHAFFGKQAAFSLTSLSLSHHCAGLLEPERERRERAARVDQLVHDHHVAALDLSDVAHQLVRGYVYWSGAGTAKNKRRASRPTPKQTQQAAVGE